MKKLGLLNIILLVNGMSTLAMAASPVEFMRLMEARDAYQGILAQQTEGIKPSWVRQNSSALPQESADVQFLNTSILRSRAQSRQPDELTINRAVFGTDHSYFTTSIFKVPDMNSRIAAYSLSGRSRIRVAFGNGNGIQDTHMLIGPALKLDSKAGIGEDTLSYRQILSRQDKVRSKEVRYSLLHDRGDALKRQLNISWTQRFAFADPDIKKVVVSKDELTQLLGKNANILEVKADVNFDQPRRRVTVVYVAHDKFTDTDVIYQKDFKVVPIDAAHPAIDKDQTHRLVETDSKRELSTEERVAYLAIEKKTVFFETRKIEVPDSAASETSPVIGTGESVD